MQHFDRIQTDDSLLNRIQDRIKSVVNAIAGREIIDGRIITTAITAVGGSVAHGLGRIPNGWIVLNGIPNDFVTANAIQETNAPDKNFLYLIALTQNIPSAKLWVF
jgi:hypothetical protein